MEIRAHHYFWGDIHDLELLDRIAEGLAQGGVLATRAWMEAELAAGLDIAATVDHFDGYRPNPPSCDRDPRCQLVKLGPATDGVATCLDLAIYHAAWLQVTFPEMRDRVWVRIQRDSPDTYAHASVAIVDDEGGVHHVDDPSRFWEQR
jgi:hypothetical protein